MLWRAQCKIKARWDLLQVWNPESFSTSRRNGCMACGPSRVSCVQCCCLQQKRRLASLHLYCAVHIRGMLGWHTSKSFLGNCEHLGETSSLFLLFSLHFFFFSPCSLLFLFTPFFHVSSLSILLLWAVWADHKLTGSPPAAPALIVTKARSSPMVRSSEATLFARGVLLWSIKEAEVYLKELSVNIILQIPTQTLLGLVDF